MPTRDQPTVKKPPKNLDTNSFSAKRPPRIPKKTVLTIAPSESTEMDFDDMHEDSSVSKQERLSTEVHRENKPRRVERAGTICSDLAAAISCRIMAVALQGRSFSTSYSEYDITNTQLDCALDDLEAALGTSIDGANGIIRLQSLLDRLNRGELSVQEHPTAEPDEYATKILSNAVHAVIAAQCQRSRFDEAVEKVSRRAIYQFAYGLTHEINNPLANIAARAQQLIANAASESDRRSLATIVDQSMRAHEMLAEMMRVVLPSPIQTRIEDVVAVAKHSMETQEKLWKHVLVQCHFGSPSKPLYAAIDKTLLQEAISSLLQNAFQVCRPNDRIEIVCEELAANHPEYGPSNGATIPAPPRIRIAVRDSGPGMSSETVEAAWDLYFSGREHGRGLGISLAKVRQTIDAHDGFVWIQSKPNAGCSVEIRLPKAPESPSLRKVLSV